MNAGAFGFQLPALLWLLPLAALPWLAGLRRRSPHPWLGAAPEDTASRLLDLGLRALGSLALAGFAVGAAGPVREGGSIERISTGANLVLLIDRSSSMNDSFAGRTPQGGEESKAQAARRLLAEFTAGRPHDRVGVAAFSTSPMRVLPMTDRGEAVQAAIAAIDRPGLTYTDVGRGLAMALELFDDEDPLASRALLLVSDGAAVIDPRVQSHLRAAVVERPVHLYWLFLRSAGSPGIGDAPGAGRPDTPQAMPERHLDLFLRSLGVPYQAFEAEDPNAVAAAIEAIGARESRPLVHRERLPRRDLGAWAFGLASLATLLLAAAKLMEVRLGAAAERAA